MHAQRVGGTVGDAPIYAIVPLLVGVPTETAPGERRVALAPDAVRRLTRSGVEVVVERGAGENATITDADFESAGARLGSRPEGLGAGLIATVQGLPEVDRAALQPGTVVVGFLRALDDADGIQAWAASGATTLAMELVPRTTKAQKMDALSAMSTVAGYRAALIAAERLPKFFPLLTTAAGTVRPAKVLVLGAGVAGLQALATARRLGAVTAAYDVREAAREQVESVGATFVELDLDTAGAEDAGGYAKSLDADAQTRQVEALARLAPEYDVVISTALIPGRAAPLLLSETAIDAMRPGSVVVDLAAPNGGNCAVSQPGSDVMYSGVSVLAPLDLAAGMPRHASEMYGRTVAALISEFLDESGEWAPDPADEIYSGALVTEAGAIVHPRVLAQHTPNS